MSNQRYTPEFKDEAARQIVDRGYSVADVSGRLVRIALRTAMALLISITDQPRRRAKRRTGSRPFPDKAGGFICASTHRLRRILTKVGEWVTLKD